MNTFYSGSWSTVFTHLTSHPAGKVVRVPKHSVMHPQDEGARRSIGLPVGQQSDYRWVVGDCRGLHVRDFGTHYDAHIDHVDPACDLVEHLRKDAPGTYVLGATALGGLIGILLGNNKDAFLAGATLGAAVGALTTDSATNKSNETT